MERLDVESHWTIHPGQLVLGRARVVADGGLRNRRWRESQAVRWHVVDDRQKVATELVSRTLLIRRVSDVHGMSHRPDQRRQEWAEHDDQLEPDVLERARAESHVGIPRG